MSGRSPAPSSGQPSGSAAGKPTSAAPNPVAQQAQQYLEQNIQAWMQPKSQAPQLFSGSLTTMVASSGSTAPYSRGLNGLSPSSSNSSGGGHGGPQDPLQLRQPRSGAAFYPMLPLSTSFPHSLSLSGYSPTSVLQGTSFSSPCASSGATYAVTQQPSAAASFFARAAQRLNLSSKKRRRHGSTSEPEQAAFSTNFAEVLRTTPPPAPPALLRAAGRKDAGGLGKVKVMLRICPTGSSSSFLTVDSRKRQVAIADPSLTAASTPADRRAGVSAPKMFAFDAIFPQDDTQTEICSSSLTDVIQAVVNGTDGCLFVYGHSKLGKSYTMTGNSVSTGELGVIPCAISWLFRLINEHKQKTGARFSVRVSAVEITGRSEALKDLLVEHANGTEGSGPSPAVYLRDDPVFGTRLMNQTELRAPTPDKAAFLLDAAIAARSPTETEDDSRNSHFLFTLHVYQYRVEKGSKGGVAGGRSRLHLFDLGSCEKPSKAGRTEAGSGPALTLSALGNVVLALFNGQKHVPYKDSKVTQVLREALGSVTCRAAMIAHVSADPAHYAETLATVQLASRVHRIRRKKFKYMGVGTSDDDRGLSRPMLRSLAVSSEEGVKSGSSDPDYTSSSEQSCDTVIYVGAAGLAVHDRDLTDNESPPALLPLQVSTEEAPTKSALPSAVPSTTSSRPSTQAKGVVQASDPSKTATAKPEPKVSKEAQASTQGVRKVSTKRSGTKPVAAVVGEPVVTANAGTNSPSGKPGAVNPNAKPKSDELWIDGPRFYKPKFDSRTLHQLTKEQWVDGPAVNYGYMDDHKQDMIRKWVEEHSRHVQDKLDRSKIKEIWIDFPGAASQTRTITGSPSTPKKDSKRRQHPPQAPVPPAVASVTPTAANDSSAAMKEPTPEDEAAEEDSAADSASTTADIDEADYELENQDSLFEKELEEALGDVQSSLSRQVVMEYAESDDDQPPEMIEVMEPDEPVQMQDSCLQVNEEDIIAACWMLEGGSLAQAAIGRENPLPEVDQESFDGGRHPLHMLSRDDLNLASSFTDSRSVSVDLDNVSVPDDPGMAWKFLRGQLQPPKFRETSAMKGEQLAQRLERIAKLREMAIGQIPRFSDRASDDLSVPKVSSVGGLPPRTARFTMSDMLFGGSRESSLDDMIEDVTSIHSEPAELDFDRCDYKFNVKPMNGLKLEAFYNKLYNTTSFLDHALQSKSSAGLTGSLRGRSSTTCFSVPKLETYQKILPSSPQLSSPKHKSQHRTSTGHLVEAASDEDKTKRNSLDLQKRNSITSLRHPDGASNPHLHKHPSMTQLQVDVRTASPSKTPPQRSPGNGASGSDVEDRKSLSLDSGPTEKILLTPGPSPTAKLSRLSRLLGRSAGSPEKSKCKEGSPSKHCRSSPKGSPKLSHKQPHPLQCPVAKHIAYEPVWIPSRGSPASSSTGAPTMCCNSGKASRTKSSSKQSPAKHCSPKAEKPRKNGGCDGKKSKAKPLQRSTSSPVPSSDEKEEVIRCDEDLDCVGGKGCGPRRPSGLPSPYSLITKARLTHPSSSGHGSDSSVNSGEQGKEPLIGKVCAKGPQCSGTSSGYESILRDSEGTPLSSSSQNSECEDIDRDGGRGRKGKRKKTQGSAKRSRSAPARVPNESSTGAAFATGVTRRSPVDSQPVSARSRHIQHWGNGRLRTSEEEVCCTGLLCCRLLDFY